MLKWFDEREEVVKKRLGEIEKQQNKLEEELRTIEIIKTYLQVNYIPNKARELFAEYIINITAYCNWVNVHLASGEIVSPDETLMRRVEDKIGVSENAKKAFREEIIIRLSSYARKGKAFDYESDDRLHSAILKAIQ